MPHPLVSVIVPNYCHAPYLRERLDSILDQTFREFELILLDDCSTDDSRTVLESYKNHPRVSHIVFNETNSGSTFRQWALGFGLAQGKYIWIAESDDVAEPAFLEKCIAELESDPACTLAYTNSIAIDSDSVPLPGRLHNRKPFRKEGRRFVIEKMFTGNAIYNASMAVFRKSALANVTEDYAKYRYCGDWLFWSRIALGGRVAYLAEPLNRFRQHHVKVSPRAKAEGLQFIEGKEVIETLFRLTGVSSAFRRAVIGRWLQRLERFGDTARPELFRRVQSLWLADYPHPKRLRCWRQLYHLLPRPFRR
ncbi:glycosyltransferase [uncultured Rikenella sp.]|uniref:glycosyltransferase family 2 protein n=1 Tax=uncultured Rikenella sp. TaxID=368003 RepID=UPI002623DCAE|nr:glycosyltransferase [uncultured Rikenella sp.]